MHPRSEDEEQEAARLLGWEMEASSVPSIYGHRGAHGDAETAGLVGRGCPSPQVG